MCRATTPGDEIKNKMNINNIKTIKNEKNENQETTSTKQTTSTTTKICSVWIFIGGKVCGATTSRGEIDNKMNINNTNKANKKQENL